MSDSDFEGSFSKMFDEGFAVPVSFDPGQPVDATVVRVGESNVFIN